MSDVIKSSVIEALDSGLWCCSKALLQVVWSVPVKNKHGDSLLLLWRCYRNAKSWAESEVWTSSQKADSISILFVIPCLEICLRKLHSICLQMGMNMRNTLPLQTTQSFFDFSQNCLITIMFDNNYLFKSHTNMIEVSCSRTVVAVLISSHS